jgi:hypothetical protein
VYKVLANLSGKLLDDVQAENPQVIVAPRPRIAVRCLLGVLLVGLLFGLASWSFTTSPQLASSIYVARFYKPTLDQVKAWEKNVATFECEPTTFQRPTLASGMCICVCNVAVQMHSC